MRRMCVLLLVVFLLGLLAGSRSLVCAEDEPSPGGKGGEPAQMPPRPTPQEEAVRDAREDLLLAAMFFGSDSAEVAEELNYLALRLKELGAFEEARQVHERALDIQERKLGREHPDVAASLGNLALLLSEQGAYEEARPLFERALAIDEKAHGPEHPDVATCLGNLGMLRMTQGAFEDARALLERALGIREQALPPNDPDVATSLGHLATLLERQGAYEEARPLYERALAIYVEGYGPEHPEVARHVNNLALVFLNLGSLDEAQAYLERAVAITEKAAGPSDPELAATLGNLGSVYVKQGAIEKARRLYTRALEINERAYGPEHPDVALSLGNLAGLHASRREFAEARPHFERALEIHVKALGPGHPVVSRSQNNLAGALMFLGDHEPAARLYRACLDGCEATLRRGFSALDARQRRRSVSSIRGFLGNWILWAPKVNASGYAEVLRFKGIVARATQAERRLVRRARPEALRGIAALRAAERRLSILSNARPTRGARRAAWKEAHAVAGAERERLALGLARDLAPLREGRARLDLRLQDVRSQLASSEILVDFLRINDRYMAWVVGSTGDPQRLDLGAAEEVEAAVAAFRHALADTPSPSRGPLSVPAADVSEEAAGAGEALRELVFAPVESKWGEEVDTVYICPDAALAAVPFAALPGRVGERLLIEDYVLVNLAVAQHLVPWDDEPESGAGAVAIGDVNYALASEDAASSAEPARARLEVQDRAPRGGSFLPLPETRGEVAFIRERLGGDCQVVLDSAATEACLRALTPGKRILHLATHGFVREDLLRRMPRRLDGDSWLGAAAERQLAVGHDPMNLSGLALAGANPREGGHGDDGILTAAEASYLDLDGVDLVVLSACQTALGKAESGEGVIGLVQGFRMAGAKRVVASLWQVDDEATRLLMQHLYDGMAREVDPLSPAEALREAALKVRGATGEGGRSFAAPKYWAAFVCYGR